MLKISIVTPNYNGSQTIRETIESVLACGYGNLEYIILDGGSSDGSQGIIDKYQHRLSFWRSQQDDGQYAAIQQGFDLSTGEIMSWLNSDDMYFPWTLHVVSEIFANFPCIQWITGLRTLRDRGATRKILSFHSYPRELIRCGLFDGENLSVIQQESVFWRRKLWRDVGGLDTSYALGADFDLWRRFAERAELYAVETPLAGFHYRDGQNRSIEFFDQYKDDIKRSVDAIDSNTKRQRARLLKRLRLFNRWRWLHGVRGGLRRAYGINKLTGPILVWSKSVGEYRIFHSEMIK